jgi:hypothetical protein
MGADPFMDLRWERSTLLPGDAVELDSSFTSAVELAIYQHIHLGLASDPFHLHIIIGKCLVLEVLQQLLGPRRSYSFS